MTILHANSIPEDSKLEYDLCIIGAGAAGLTIAHSLRDQGLSIVVLEAGSEDFDPSVQAVYEGKNIGPVEYMSLDICRLRMFGGSTNHWEGSCNDFDEIDFTDRPWVPRGGWPFLKSELVPYYQRAQEYAQLGPYNYRMEWWAQKLGMAAPYFLEDGLVGEITQHSPPTRFGEVYGPALSASETVRVILGANVQSLQLDGGLGRAVKIARVGKGPLELTAHRFVIALGGVENARFLLLNDIGNESGVVGRYFMEHPYFRLMMLAPSRKFVRFLEEWGDVTSDGVRISAAMKFSESILRRDQFQNGRIGFEPTDRYSASQGIESFHELARGNIGGADELFYHIGNLVLDVDMLAEAVSRDKRNAPILPQANDIVGFTIGIMTEQLPNPDCRVLLGSELDRFGQRRIEMDYRLSDGDKIAAGKLAAAVQRTFGRVGIGRVRTVQPERFAPWPPRRISYGSHHMGTTRMGLNPKTSVVDANLKLHNAGNVYVAGSSVFPTGSHVPPTLTIIAMALRLADHLKRTPV